MNRKQLKKILVAIQLLCLAGGLLMTARPVYHFLKWKVKEFNGRRTWARMKDSAQSTLVRASGKPAAWLRVPAVGVDTLVLYDANKENLGNYPCLETSGAGPDQGGAKVILGHRDMHFRKLKDIAPGHEVEFRLPGQWNKTYRVKETEILSPEQVPQRIKEKNQDDWLVLVTCHPFKYTGPAPNRFLVWTKAM